MHSRVTFASAGALLFAGFLLPLPAQTAAPALAPAAEPPLAFDVVSVKENPGPKYEFMGAMDQPGGLDAVEALPGLIADAFGMRREFVSCKLPLCDKPVYEIRARLAPEDQARFGKLTWEQKVALLQPILKDRFGLQTHLETRPTNVYDLVVAKGGSKLKPPPADPVTDKSGARGRNGEMYIFPTQLRGFAINLTTFVNVLSQFVGNNLGRPVIDKTGLIGTYDVDLKWTDPVHASTASQNGPGSDENAPGIFAALPEQLGLELKPAREPEPVLVVDNLHAPTPD